MGLRGIYSSEFATPGGCLKIRVKKREESLNDKKGEEKTLGNGEKVREKIGIGIETWINIYP